VVTEDQREVIEFLSSSATHNGAAVERVETHSAIVFLAGARALKLKRAVLFDYLDFSTSDRRRAMCEAEVRLNQRTAPGIYRGLLPIVRAENGSLRLGGTGSVVDWVIDMTRFDQDSLLDRIAARGEPDLALMTSLASHIAGFHSNAAARRDHGGRPGMAWVIDGNAESYRGFAHLLDARECERLTQNARVQLNRDATLLDSRRESGYVRQCHGDLHLRNIVVLHGTPTLFDAIEFNDEIACIDVWYDVAFLLMDLWRRQLRTHANALFNRYLAETGDDAGLALLPLFLSCRAAIRAKTSATSALLTADRARVREWQQTARSYLQLAAGFLEPQAPALVAVGGLSGSGKSTLAHRLAPSLGSAPGAVMLRSDEIRKQLCGVSSQTRLGPDGYRPHVSEEVYRTLSRRARQVLSRGHGVVADAVFGRETDRDAIACVAEDAGVPFVGVWLNAPAPVLKARVAQRTGDSSDADIAVVEEQLAHVQPPGNWSILGAANPIEDVIRDAVCIYQTSTNRHRSSDRGVPS
jgi:hypothetical protein